MAQQGKGKLIYTTMALAFLWLFGVSENTFAQDLTQADSGDALTHYCNHWKRSVRHLTKDSADFIGLPHPYSTPTLAGNKMFQEMYYWDSYFINRGLIAYGTHPQRNGESTPDEQAALQQAINNCNNLIWLVEKFGHVPNANRYSMTNRSQPPMLGAMVSDIYNTTKDTVWLRRALNALEMEHSWWMRERFLGLSTSERKLAPHSLGYNHYGHDANDAFLLRFGRFLSGRLGDGFDSLLAQQNQNSFQLPNQPKQGKGLWLLGHMLAEAESGWDFTPRFHARCMNVAPLDLNCLLYITERTLFEGYSTLKNRQKSNQWKSIAKNRKELINKLFYDKHTGWYWDYDIALGHIHRNSNAAQFMPYFAKIAPNTTKHRKALHSLSNVFVGRYGVHPCLPILTDSMTTSKNQVRWATQWNSPNAWPPLTHFVAEALGNYSQGNVLKSPSSKSLATKRRELIQGYLQSVETQFILTGKFWEKYNLHFGTLDVTNEYAMPDFFGWTAGVYMEYRTEFVGP